MANSHTTRRTVIAAIGALPLAASAVPALAEPQGEASDAAPDNSGEIAMLWMARAWVDRWNACGGDFGCRYNPDGSFHSVMRGVPEPRFWTPTDEGNAELPPHCWLIEKGHHAGAVKVLEAMLELVPGLRDTITQIVGAQLFVNAVRAS